MCKKCDARAELLFCLLNLMFRDTVASLDLKVPIDVVDVVDVVIDVVYIALVLIFSLFLSL